jgi:hypothetical protein
MEQSKENVKKYPIHFSMNMPGWFMNIPTVDEKCKIVEDLANDLKDEPPISKEQRKKLFSIH